MRNSHWILLFIMFLVLGFSDLFAAEKTEPFKLKVTSSDSVSAANLNWLAEDLGFMAEENLAFEYVGVVPSGQLVASVVAGKLDIGGAHINRTIAGISAGAKVTAVVAGSETLKDVPHMSYMVLNNSPLRRGKDLLGAKIGLSQPGGCHEYTPYGWMIQDSILKPKGKYHIVLTPVANLEQVLRQGNVDVVGIHSNPDLLISHGGIRTLFTDYDIWQNKGGNTPNYFSNKFIAEHPDVVQRYVRVYVKVIDWNNSHPNEGRELTFARAKKEKIPVLKDEFRWIYYAPHGIIKKETVDVWFNILKDMGDVKPSVKAQDIYTNKFNPYWKPSAAEPY